MEEGGVVGQCGERSGFRGDLVEFWQRLRAEGTVEVVEVL